MTFKPRTLNFQNPFDLLIKEIQQKVDANIHSQRDTLNLLWMLCMKSLEHRKQCTHHPFQSRTLLSRESLQTNEGFLQKRKIDEIETKTFLKGAQFHGGTVGDEFDTIELGELFEDLDPDWVLPLRLFCGLSGNGKMKEA